MSNYILEKLAETLAPGQGKELLALAKLGTDTEKHPSTDTCSNKEIVNNQKEIYDAYVVNRMPFVEQVRLLALLPRLCTLKKIGFLRNPQKRFRRLENVSKCVKMLKKRIFNSTEPLKVR